MKTKTKVISATITLLALIGLAFGANYLLSVQQYQDTVATITYDNLNAATIPDGTYIGECDVNFISAQVAVTVVDGTITKIDLLKHKHDRGAAAEGIEQEIINQQLIDVDAISGATNSSTVIKKAVDNALSSAVNNQK